MGIGKILAISLGTLASLGTIGGITGFLVTNKQNTSSVSIDELSSVSKKEVNEEKEMVSEDANIEVKTKKKRTPLSAEKIKEITDQIKGSGEYAWAKGASDNFLKSKPEIDQKNN